MKPEDNANNSLQINTDTITPQVLSDDVVDAIDKLKETNEKIKNGIETPTASTGTPMDELYGGAKFMARLANIGNGSLAAGGGGVQEGFETIMQNTEARTIVATALGQTQQVSIATTNNGENE